MRRLLRFSLVVVMLGGVIASAADAQSRLVVTAKDLIARDHRVEVGAGTEVVWGDPHIDRVWFPPSSGIEVRRTEAGLAAVFPKPGRYEGRVTLTATHGAGAADVMRLLVIVTEPGR